MSAASDSHRGSSSVADSAVWHVVDRGCSTGVVVDGARSLGCEASDSDSGAVCFLGVWALGTGGLNLNSTVSKLRFCNLEMEVEFKIQARCVGVCAGSEV